MNSLRIAILAAVVATLAGCAANPKILVSQSFTGANRTGRLLIQDTGKADPASGQRLFDLSARVCDLKDGKQENCKDSQIIDNVVPGSVY